MSQWTHVAGTIRLDSIFHQNFERRVRLAFDTPVSYEDMGRTETRVPMGSEGSIQYAVTRSGYEKENTISATCCVLSMWGDLRDRGDDLVPDVCEWIKEALERLPDMYVRQLVIQVEIEFGNTYIIRMVNDELDVQVLNDKTEE